MKDQFMAVKEMSTVLGVAEKTIYKWGPKIPGYIKIGGKVLFNRRTFEEKTKGHEPKPTENLGRADNRHGL